MQKTFYSVYLEQVRSGRLYSEGAKELASRAKEYMEKKEKQEKSFESMISALKDLADGEFHELTPEDFILPVVACDEHPDEIPDDLAEEVDKAFDAIAAAVYRMQEVAGKIAKAMESAKNKRTEGNTIPK